MPDQRDELPPELMAAIAAHEQAHGSGELADLNVAVAAWNKVLTHPLIVSTPHLERMAFNQIGTALLERYELSGREEDLDRAIKFTGQAVRGEPKGSDMLSRFLAAFSSALRARYVLHRDDADLTATTEAMELSVSELREPWGELAERLTELSVLRRLRHEADGDLDALDEAVDLAGRALALGGLGPAQQAKTLTVLGNALMIRSVHRPEDLEGALAAYQEALDSGTGDRAGRPILLINIGTLLLQRFNGTEDLADLERATVCLREAESDPGLTGVLRPALVMKLAEALQTTSKLTGDRQELDEFVAGPFASTLERTASGSPYRRDATEKLAWALLERYGWHSTADDLDQGIGLLRDTAAGLAPDAAATRVFPALGTLLRVRYERHGRLDDLMEAVEVLRRAAEMESLGFRRAQILYNLVVAVRRRFEQTREPADLHTMLEAAAEAVDESPADDPDRPLFLINLGQVLDALYGLTGDPDDLGQALTYWREAIGLLPPSSLLLTTGLNSLALGLIEQFKLSGNTADLREAIPAFQKVIAFTPQEAPDLPGLLNNLANGLLARYEANGDEDDLTEAISAVRAALALPQLGALAALKIARSWGRNAASRGAWAEAAELYGPGLKATRKLFETQVGREHKEIWLRDASGLPGEAAYVFARTGTLYDAVAALEQGRARLLSEVMERNEADLEEIVALGRSELRDRFREAARQLSELELADLSR
jgi:hypothetical protein